MTGVSRIPTAADFARASRLMQEKSQGLDEVRNTVLLRFRKSGRLHDFFILDQRDVDFRAYVFVVTTRDIEIIRDSGVQNEIIECVYSELERIGRGNRNQIRVAFEFDSDENVTANFDGDYYMRLH